MRPACNFCNSSEFAAFKNRPNEQCISCGSIARHRIALGLYKNHGIFREEYDNNFRVLHFAPEKLLHPLLLKQLGSRYSCADAVPEGYTYAQCLQIFLPEGVELFPVDYFDFIIHNHVLEHVPGTYKDHFRPLIELLKVGGKMIFSVPGPRMSQVTVEGGEHQTEQWRLENFHQSDHLRMFGKDMPQFLKSIDEVEFSWDDLTPEFRASINVPANNRFIILTKIKPTPRSAFNYESDGGKYREGAGHMIRTAAKVTKDS